MTNELKPCPFCGHPVARVFRDSGRYRVVVHHQRDCPWANLSYRTKTAAIAAWNTRPAEDALRAELEQISGAYLDERSANARLEVENATLRAELSRVAPYLAVHNVYGFTLAPKEPPHD